MHILYQRHVERLERKQAVCRSISRRYSWLRLGLFLVGGAAVWACASAFGGRAGWASFAAAALLFTVIVILHRRLDEWETSFRIWQALYREKIARLALDWEHIPPPADPAPASPLAFDLDLTGPRSLHHLLDAAISRQGSRLLAGWLASGLPDPLSIAERQAAARELSRLPRFRNRLALIFRRLSREPLDGDKLLDWLKTPFPERRLRQVLPGATLLALANLALLGLSLAGRLPPVWMLSTLLYVGVYFSSHAMLEEFLEAVVRLDSELAKFRPLLRFLERFRYPQDSRLQALCAPFWSEASRPSLRLRQAQALTVLVGLRSNYILGLLLNLFIPWDFWVAWLAARQRRGMGVLLPVWLEAFHQLEALISLGEFAALHPEYAFPELLPLDRQPEAVFSAAQVGHPLLPAARKVRNDLHINALGELLIITGSNMAGKSTFVRTVGINLCLAYAGAPVDAARLSCLPFRLYTCIRINDSLGDGFSYFYAEVKRLKGLLDALQSDPSGLPLLYLIDEIFRGTNNRERLIGSRAYVKSLIGAHGVGLIATHDLELAALAGEHPQARNVHFSDQVIDGKLTFDYRLRPGVSPTTNALKIMAIEGLPVPDQQS